MVTRDITRDFPTMKHLITLLKAAISIGLIIYLLSITDLERMVRVIQTSTIGFLFWAAAAFIISVIVLGLRWQVLLRVHGIAIGFFRLVSLYFVGFFFNNFLPSTIGGDVVRIYKSASYSRKRHECIASVVVERIIGFLAMAVLAFGGIVVVIQRLNTTTPLVFILVFLFLVVGVFLLVTRRTGQRLIRSVTKRFTWFHIGSRIESLLDSFILYRDNPRSIILVFLISLLYQTVMISFCYIISLAISMHVRFIDFFVCVPVVAILGMVPSINGIGIREGGYVYLLTRLGKVDGSVIQSYEALSFSILVLGISTVMSLIGGFLFLFEREKPALETMRETVEEKVVPTGKEN